MDRDSLIIAMSETPANPPNPAVPAVVTLPGTVQVSKKELMAPRPTFVADVAEEYRARFAAVANDDTFRRCTTFRAQCKRANALINGSLPKKQRVPLKHFAAFFRVRSCASIHTQITAPTDDYVFCGRRPILTDADVDAIIGWVAESVDNPRTLLTLNNIVERVEAELHKAVSKDCVRAHLAARGATKVMTAMPMEEGRALVPEAVKREYVARMEGVVGDILSAFVYNVDECGIQEFADAKPVDVIVPASYNRETLEYASRRNAYRSTLVAGICADGSALKPVFIIKQKMVPDQIILDGWTKDKVLFVHTESGFVNGRLFVEWFNTVFVPDVRRKRELFGKPDQKAVLLMDGCSAHTVGQIEEAARNNNIEIQLFPPHTSHLFQPLDPCLFGALKKRLQKGMDVDETRAYNHLSKLVAAYEKCTTNNNIMASFRRAGFHNTRVENDFPLVTFHRSWVSTYQATDDDAPVLEPPHSNHRHRIPAF